MTTGQPRDTETEKERDFLVRCAADAIGTLKGTL
jgi:hypothetical protein